jgi:hypothetical protein
MSEPPARGPVVGSMRVTLGALDSSVSMKPMPMQVSIWLELLGKMLMKISWEGIGVQQTAAVIVEVDRRDGNSVSAHSATRCQYHCCGTWRLKPSTPELTNGERRQGSVRARLRAVRATDVDHGRSNRLVNAHAVNKYVGSGAGQVVRLYESASVGVSKGGEEVGIGDEEEGG